MQQKNYPGERSLKRVMKFFGYNTHSRLSRTCPNNFGFINNYLKSRQMFDPNPVRDTTVYFTAKYRLDPIETKSTEI